MVRVLVSIGVVVVITNCTKAQPEEPPRREPLPTPVHSDAGPPGPQPLVIDAAPAPSDAPPPITMIDVPTLAVAGPYPTLEASCAAARPCGFTAVDAQQNPITPPTTPDCSAVLDPGQDETSKVPASYNDGSHAELVRSVPGGELRIGGVRCSIAKGERGDHSEHYVFLKRADGWWRTVAPVFEHSYNEKYCTAGMYVLWNVKAARTILGIAGARECVSCGKQMMSSDASELMLRVETTGAKPRVFAPLPVGTRITVWDQFHFDDPTRSKTDVDCKVGTTATSMKEKWPTDDEVILEGPAAATGGPETKMFTMGSLSIDRLARPGHYRFPR